MSAEEFYRRERELSQFHQPRKRLNEAWYVADPTPSFRYRQCSKSTGVFAKVLRSFFNMLK
ncbi:hypothetical protein [Paenibacillus macerans]|uniref:hypothetical protein n=1 Tax=Paenibacillus macerans TaxID=44252 RepID=UPI003D31DD94